MMSSSDAIIWNIERDPQLRSTVMSVWVLDSVPTAERMAANTERMVAAIPRLRQVAVDARPRPMWRETDVDIEDHYDVIQLNGEADLEDAMKVAEAWVAEPFDRTKPLWKLGLVTGLAGGRAAIVIKVHHAIADGMGMVLMLAAFTDLERHPAPADAAVTTPDADDDRPAFSRLQRLRMRIARGWRRFVDAPVDTTIDTWLALVSAVRLVFPNRRPHSRLMTGRSGEFNMDTRRVDLDAFKAAARTNGASLNDLFVTVVGDAVARYHTAQGITCPRLRLHMPVDVRNGRTATLAGNQFVPARISLDVPVAVDRLGVGLVRQQLDELRREPALHHVNTVSAAIQRLGKPISRWIIGGMMKGVDVLASNVPGPPLPLYLAGAQVEEFYAFGPPAGASLNVTLFSYDGGVGLGITSDAAAITDRGRFLRCLDESLEAVQPTRSPQLVVA